MLITLLIIGLMAMAAAAASAAAEKPAAEDNKFWRAVRNELPGQPTEAEIHIFGYLAADWWDAWMPDDT